jgi:pyruvate dehydrogenase E2 component (dihydrolipoamide acetyltransferase)
MEVFNLPDLGEGLPDAEIVRWFVKVGDIVEADQPLAEMETAKAVVEVPAPESGRVVKLHGEPGDLIETGKPLVSFGNAEEFRHLQTDETIKSETEEKVSKSTNKSIKVAPPVLALAKKLKVDLETVTATGKKGEVTLTDIRNAAKSSRDTMSAIPEKSVEPISRVENNTVNVNFTKGVRAAPKVRAYAAEASVDIRALRATGHKDNVTLKDVKNKWISATKTRAETLGDYKLPERSQEVTGEPQPIRGERRAMALAMAKTRDTTVNTTIHDKAYINAWHEGTDISVRLLRATIAACMVEPALNAWFDGEKMQRTLHKHVNIGLAVDSPHGLSVPVIRNAETLSAPELRAEINRLREAVYNKTIKPEELKDPSITLSNFGVIAGLFATPIALPPQVAIVATGRMDEELQLKDEGIIKSRYIPLSISFDHRGATGGDAARFLAAYVADLALPY